MTTITKLTTTRNRYDDGDEVAVRFMGRYGVREGWIARSDRHPGEGWFWGVAPTMITADSAAVKAARRLAVDQLPGPFSPGDVVEVDGDQLTVPDHVRNYGSGTFV